MKYPDQPAVDAKIDDLFAFRKISSLMTFADPKPDAEWVGHLRHLQYVIYLLDAYLEGEWKLDPAERQLRWEDIRNALAALGHEGKKARRLLQEIKAYERVELDCRKDRWPTRIGMKTFYTTKSCDVRLMRRLLYLFSPSLGDHWEEKGWRYFDRVAEVHDDISDLLEDLETWNANRFLVSLLRDGIPDTRKQYEHFIQKTARQSEKAFAGFAEGDANLQVAALTQEMCDLTLSLLHSTLEGLDPNRLGDSWLLGKMK